MSFDTAVFAMGSMILGTMIVGAILLALRHEHHARLGRMLLEAAGTEKAARMAIESANLDRLLSQKYENEYERAMRREVRKLPRNVLRFPPITNRGQPVHFEPPGVA